jgi:hypothetical protein
MRIILIFILSAFVIFSVRAQNGARRSAEERAQRIIEDPSFLNFKLSAEQQTKIYAILIAQNKSLDSLIGTIPPGNNSQQAIIKVMAPKRVAIISANDKRIIALLSDDQKKAYEDYVKQRPAGSVFGGIANSSGVSR